MSNDSGTEDRLPTLIRNKNKNKTMVLSLQCCAASLFSDFKFIFYNAHVLLDQEPFHVTKSAVSESLDIKIIDYSRTRLY
jgi:hypothetical protein